MHLLKALKYIAIIKSEVGLDCKHITYFINMKAPSLIKLQLQEFQEYVSRK